MLTRRDLLKILLASPVAATVDVEQLLWVPKPIVVVPAMPSQRTLSHMFIYAGRRHGMYCHGWVQLSTERP